MNLLDVEIVLVKHTSRMVAYSLFHYKRGCWWNPKDPEGSINGLWNSQGPSKNITSNQKGREKSPIKQTNYHITIVKFTLGDN